jgi:hypothetical protein
MVPSVEFPLVTAFTDQVMAVFGLPVTEAWNESVLPTVTLAVLVAGVVMEMETDAGFVIVTVTDADLVVSAWLVAVMLNFAGDGTADGAL